MSLLIKALDKAESDKVERASTKQKQAEKNKAKTESPSDLELSLSPADSVLVELAPVAKASDVSTQSTIQTSSQTASQLSKSVTAPLNPSTSSNSPKSAANVFSAKGVEARNQNTRLALIGGAGLVALLGMGLYFYQFVDNAPDVVIPQRPQEQLQAQVQEQAPELIPEPFQEIPVTETQAFEPNEIAPLPEQQVAPRKMAKKQAASEGEALVENEMALDDSVTDDAIVVETVVGTKANKKGNKSKNLQFGDAIASRSASIEVTKTQSAVGINPVLMSAYEAYSAGDDAKAQKLYKQVLQQDVRNVDALLGLGAIASRQGREADANSWFGKVLEIDPRNNMAQAALLENQSQGNEVNSESHIKNMLAKNPNDANLHVALGNLYAEQNQWPAAQQAYFDAYSLNGNADNAFNLAVSLDQMGKPKLALPYYQRALAQASSSSSIDKATLEARIAAIQ
ncbi:MAG: tetratricopeptide repeat protein [Methylotenera sp.]